MIDTLAWLSNLFSPLTFPVTENKHSTSQYEGNNYITWYQKCYR